MKNKILLTASLAITGMIVLGACAPAATPAEAPAAEAEAVLTLSGPATEISYTEEDLMGMAMTETEYTNKDGETTIYEGVAFADLLSEAGVNEFSSLTLTAVDDYSADVTAEELSGCSGCIVAFQEDGGLRAVMPDFSGKLQVKDLVSITINN